MKQSNLSKLAVLTGRVLRLALTNRRGLREVCGVALSASEGVMDPAADVLPIPQLTIEKLLAEEREPMALGLRAFPQVRFSISVLEAVGLAALMHRARAQRVFEFGTHRGVSTSQLAANLPAEGRLFTLDLPADDRRTQFEIESLPGDLEVSKFPTKGDLIPADLRGRVQLLTGDSAKFDPSPYAGSIDFVFVDAAHTAEYVANDSEKAWTMLRPGGIVAWHDCRPLTPPVVQYLRACRFQPRRLAGTTLAFATKPG